MTMPRRGTSGFAPGSIDKSKSSPAISPDNLMVFSALAVPFTDHTPVLIVSIAAATSASAVGFPAAPARPGFSAAATCGVTTRPRSKAAPTQLESIPTHKSFIFGGINPNRHFDDWKRVGGISSGEGFPKIGGGPFPSGEMTGPAEAQRCAEGKMIFVPLPSPPLFLCASAQVPVK